MKVVSNSTPLIALARIRQVNLLHAVFGRILFLKVYIMKWYYRELNFPV